MLRRRFALSAAAFFLVALCKATLSKTLWPLTIASYMGTYLLVGLGRTIEPQSLSLSQPACR